MFLNTSKRSIYDFKCLLLKLFSNTTVTKTILSYASLTTSVYKVTYFTNGEVFI